MVIFLSGRGHFYHSLKWYHYCRGFSAPSWNGTILGSYFLYMSIMVPFLFHIFSHFAQMVPYFGFQNFSHYSNGTFFVAEFCNFSIAFLFVIFCTFNECYHFFAHFSIGTLFVTKFSHFSQMVPFLFYFFRTLLK